MEEQDPYAEGADAYLAGQAMEENPYPLETHFEAHCTWNDGYASLADEDDE